MHDKIMNPHGRQTLT